MYERLLLLILFIPFVSNGQKKTIYSNVSISSVLLESSLPTEVGFQFASRVSLSVQIKLDYPKSKSKEKLFIELGLGNFINSLYFKESNLDNPRSSGHINTIDGMFVNFEPRYNLLRNKKKNLFFDFSLNHVLYLLGNYQVNSGYFNQSNEEIRMITESPNNNIQFALEPYFSASYLINKNEESSIAIRLKQGYVFHSQTIAHMSFPTKQLQNRIKLDNLITLLCIGYQFQ